MILTGSEELNGWIESLWIVDSHTKLKIARELIRQVIHMDRGIFPSSDTINPHFVSVKEGLGKIDHDLVFALGCINMGRITEQMEQAKNDGV